MDSLAKNYTDFESALTIQNAIFQPPEAASPGQEAEAEPPQALARWQEDQEKVSDKQKALLKNQ